MQEWLLITGVLLAINAAAVWQDVRTLKVSNRLIAAGIFIGILLCYLLRTSPYHALTGMLLPAMLLWPLLLFSMIGAADIKLLMVTGLILGPRMLIRAMLLSALIAGAWAAVRMTRCHLWRQRLNALKIYIRTSALQGAAAYMNQKDMECQPPWMLPLSAAVCAGDLITCLLWLPR